MLRINKKFMEFMRNEYPELTKSLVEQRFGRTVVEPTAEQSADDSILSAPAAAGSSANAAGSSSGAMDV